MSLITALWTQSFSHFSIHLSVYLPRPYFRSGVCPDFPWPSSCFPSTQVPLISPLTCQTQFQLGFGFCLTSSPAASTVPWSLQARQPLTLFVEEPLYPGCSWVPCALPHSTVIGRPPWGPRHQHFLFAMEPVSLHCSTPRSWEPSQHTSVIQDCVLLPAHTSPCYLPTLFISRHTLQGSTPTCLLARREPHRCVLAYM